MNAIPNTAARELAARTQAAMSRLAGQAASLIGLAAEQAAAMRRETPRLAFPAPVLPQAWLAGATEYAVDAMQRSLLFWDVMRQAGNAFVEHEAAGCPPVLVFAYETLLDGRSLARPVNYALVRILPDAGMPPSEPRLRPFVIIDPRAGHGAGIGGFKSDSQVGVALRRGHPVYFVIFFRDPEPGQTILDVTAAEGEFLRIVRARHPEAPKPVVIGNCQGGWAAMMLGAAEPELTGPLVLNGAPLSYWAGERGRNPMRYMGGLAGGGWPAALLADLGNGRFDGASLVLNFESLSPGNAWFRKYWNLYAQVDTEAPRFLEFERWWGGFFLMNADEIRWIVGNLFIGDRFAKGDLLGTTQGPLDMRALRSPVIVFASAGDHITPPGQALRWIADVYRDEREVRRLGQTIVYLLHEEVGHLGIFVSGKVAKKEHAEIATTLELIEAVAPGLYEMRITEAPEAADGRYQVELLERRMSDISALAGDASHEAFPAVAKISQLTDEIYDTLARPLVRAMATEASAEWRRRMHPLRLRRTLVSGRNPWLAPLAAAAALVRANRRPAAPQNPFLALEERFADALERSMTRCREAQDAAGEFAFHAVYGALAALGVGQQSPPRSAPLEDTARLEAAARHAERAAAEGGYAAAVIRMMVLLADARGGVRRSRLERSNTLLTTAEPFRSMSAEQRGEVIRLQTLIVSLQPERALATLPLLLPGPQERRQALAAVSEVAGPEAELGEPARAMLGRLRAVLGAPQPG